MGLNIKSVGGGGHAKSHHESNNYLLYVPFCAGYYEEHFVGMEVLGEGSFGVVFKAVSREDKCAYAIKISKDTCAFICHIFTV